MESKPEMKVMCVHKEMVDVDLLQPNPKNPNKHPDEQIKLLAKIMGHQGWRSPIVVSTRSGFITKGHGRLMAAKQNGWTTAPVDRQDYASEADEYADMVADNKIAELATTDMSMVNTDALELGADFDLELLGIPDFTLVDIEKVEPQCDPDDYPEKSPPRANPGDMFRLGAHYLFCGDATNIQHVERLMGEDKADFIFTDPPYNVDYKGKTKEALTIQNDKMDGDTFYQFLLDSYSSMAAVTKPGAAIYVAHADSEGVAFRKAMVDAGFLYKQCVIWVKNQLVFGRQDYQWKHEPILYGWKEGASHKWYSDRKQTTVWEVDKPQRNGEHPTMKPIQLIEMAMLNSSKPGDIVLDLFGGSGSTMIAAEKNQRASRLMELDPKYCDVILNRWEKYTGKKAELING
jgi:DNA modification methylase